MKKTIILFIAAALLANIGCQPGKPTMVILITVDSLGPGDINLPNMLALKQRGAYFSEAFSPSPNSFPATVSIMTGLHPLGHGIVGEEGYTLGQEALTLGEVFQTNHFRTAAMVGSSEFSPGSGLEQGFDAYNYTFETISEGLLPKVEARSAGKVSEDAAAWVKAFGDMPFFMWVHLGDLESHGIEKREALARIDDAIGALLAALPDRGRRALIILTAPVAASGGAHNEDGHGVLLYDATMHVPLIVAGPGVTGGESKVPTSLQDILPTLVSFIAFPMPKGIQGADLAQVLKEGKPVGIKPEWVMTTREPYELFGWSPLAALRTDSYEYIRAPKPELYDLKADPGEMKNLAAEHADIVKQMESRLAEMEKRIAQGKTPGKRAHALPEPAGNLPDPKDRIKSLPAYRNAVEAISIKDYEGALKQLAPLETADPENRRLPYLLALAYGGVGDREKAIPLLEEAVKRNPGNAIILATLGEGYMEVGDNEKALKVFEESLAIEPKVLPVHLNLGYLYQKNAAGLTGQARVETLEKALTYFINALKLGDENARTYFNVGTISVDIAKTMESIEGSIPEINNKKKNEPSSRDFINSAIQVFKLAIEKDPKMAAAHFMLAQLLANDPKAKDEAREHLEKFLELAPNDPDVPSAKKLLKELQK